MDDLSQQLNQILSDPQSMKQIQDMMGALGLGSNSPEPVAAPAPPSAPPPAPPAPGPLGALGGVTPDMLQTVSRLAPLLNKVNQEDDSTRLLRALRPLLSEARQKKLDEAIKILQMMRLLPLLKESGVFSGLLSGLI